MPTQDKPYWRKRSIAQTNSLACKLTKTQLLTNSSTHQLKNLPTSPTQKLINSKTQNLINSQLYQLTNLSTYKLTNSKAYQLKNSKVHQLTTIFRHITCILHHLAFLVGRQLTIFSLPITRFLPLKPHFLMAILPLLTLFFMAQKNYIYTIAVDIYTFCLAFSGKTHCI